LRKGRAKRACGGVHRAGRLYPGLARTIYGNVCWKKTTYIHTYIYGVYMECIRYCRNAFIHIRVGHDLFPGVKDTRRPARVSTF
jgi:hypothetical protein